MVFLLLARGGGHRSINRNQNARENESYPRGNYINYHGYPSHPIPSHHVLTGYRRPSTQSNPGGALPTMPSWPLCLPSPRTRLVLLPQKKKRAKEKADRHYRGKQKSPHSGGGGGGGGSAAGIGSTKTIATDMSRSPRSRNFSRENSRRTEVRCCCCC